jgi:hypothetical protein
MGDPLVTLQSGQHWGFGGSEGLDIPAGMLLPAFSNSAEVIHQRMRIKLLIRNYIVNIRKINCEYFVDTVMWVI